MGLAGLAENQPCSAEADIIDGPDFELHRFIAETDDLAPIMAQDAHDRGGIRHHTDPPWFLVADEIALLAFDHEPVDNFIRFPGQIPVRVPDQRVRWIGLKNRDGQLVGGRVFDPYRFAVNATLHSGLFRPANAFLFRRGCAAFEHHGNSGSLESHFVAETAATQDRKGRFTFRFLRVSGVLRRSDVDFE